MDNMAAAFKEKDELEKKHSKAINVKREKPQPAQEGAIPVKCKEKLFKCRAVASITGDGS